LDKVFHFGYFFGGAGLLAAALFLRPSSVPNWGMIIVLVVVIASAVGLLDEWHQSWSPERSGNDPGDWLADAYGALAGALVFRRFHKVLT
jgi:VanZ family protein